MNAPARDLPEMTLAETAYHESPRGGLRLGPQGDELMPQPPAADRPGNNRYTYGSGARPLDGYTIKRAIGRGGFGEVYYATSDAGKEIALKLITRNLEIERRGVVQCMNLKSPNLVAIHDLKQNADGDTFVIMEYVSGPSLAQILAQHPAGLPAAEIRMWLKGLIQGVAYLHDHGIVHRDLKPANLFLEDGTVKIGDYGLSKAITGGTQNPGHSECVGTCHYMAPETSTGKYHKAIDIYAIGVILYEMVSGRVPFDGESVGEVLMKHLTSRPDLSGLPEPFKGIVSRALAKDPNHRPVRVTDLLLPGDTPKEPELRFLGDKSSVVAPPMDGTSPKADDVIRIGMEDDSVFYIGPNTRPPQRPAGRNQWLWANPVARAVKAKRASLRRPIDTPRPAQAQAPQARPVPPVPPRPVRPPVAVKPPLPPLGPPPPLPEPRARVAELASSMLLAAPVAGLGSALVLPLTGAADGVPSTDPRMMAVVFGTTLAATWLNLIVGKVREGKSPKSKIVRRMSGLVLGALIGLTGFALAEGTNVGPTSHRLVDPQEFTMLAPSAQSLGEGALQYASFFGLAGLFAPAWGGAVRDRKSRFRLMPIVWTGMVAAVLSALFPATLPIGAIAVGVTALSTQLVSPFSREASNYRREAIRRKVA